ncbi:hypothetical protein RCL1_001805 [Eukaryota sp. TZLM3-RCL]
MIRLQRSLLCTVFCSLIRVCQCHHREFSFVTASYYLVLRFGSVSKSFLSCIEDTISFISNSNTPLCLFENDFRLFKSPLARFLQISPVSRFSVATSSLEIPVAPCNVFSLSIPSQAIISHFYSAGFSFSSFSNLKQLYVNVLCDFDLFHFLQIVSLEDIEVLEIIIAANSITPSDSTTESFTFPNNFNSLVRLKLSNVQANHIDLSHLINLKSLIIIHCEINQIHGLSCCRNLVDFDLLCEPYSTPVMDFPSRNAFATLHLSLSAKDYDKIVDPNLSQLNEISMANFDISFWTLYGNSHSNVSVLDLINSDLVILDLSLFTRVKFLSLNDNFSLTTLIVHNNSTIYRLEVTRCQNLHHFNGTYNCLINISVDDLSYSVLETLFSLTSGLIHVKLSYIVRFEDVENTVSTKFLNKLSTCRSLFIDTFACSHIFSLLPTMSSLRVLSISDINVDVLDNFSRFPRLLDLSIINCPIKVLELGSSSVVKLFLQELANLNNLRFLNTCPNIFEFKMIDCDAITEIWPITSYFGIPNVTLLSDSSLLACRPTKIPYSLK